MGVRRLDKLPSWTSRSGTIVKEKSKSNSNKEVAEKVSGGAKAVNTGENAATPEPDAEETEITLATPVLAIPLED